MCFLGKRDSDSHRIMMLTLRQPLHKTYRFRSAAGEAKVEEKKRAWKEKLEERKAQRQASKGAKGRPRQASQPPAARPRTRTASPTQWRQGTGTWNWQSGWNTWTAWTWSAAYGWQQGQGAPNEDLCIAQAINPYAVQHSEESSWIPLLLLLLCTFLLGCGFTAYIMYRHQRDKPVPLKRSVCVQSQTTYTGIRGVMNPRFQPLLENSHGVFMGD